MNRWWPLLVRHRRLAWAVLLSSQLMTALAWVVWPHQYKATAVVLADRQPSPVRTVADDPALAVMGARAALLMSESVAQRVIRRLQLQAVPQLRALWEKGPAKRGMPYEYWLVQLVQGGLYPTAGKGGLVLQLGYVSSDPLFATTMANAYAHELVTAVSDINQASDQGLERPVGESLAREVTRMRTAHERLSALSRQKGVLDVGPADVVYQQAIREQDLAVRSLVATDASRALASGLREGRVDSSVLDDTVLQKLRVQLADLSRQQDQAMATLGVNHPDVAKLDAAIQRTQVAMREHIARMQQQAGAQAGIRGSALAQRDANQATTRQDWLAELPDRASLKQAQTEFNAAADEYEQLAVSATMLALNRGASKSDMVLLEEASQPLLPWFPDPVYVVPGSIGLGLVFMMLACGLAERAAPRVGSRQALRNVVREGASFVLPAGRPPGPPNLAQRAKPAGSLPTWSSWLCSLTKPWLSPVMLVRSWRKRLRR